MKKKRKIFMTQFYIVMLVALVLIIGVWNHVADFKTAYLQALLFLEIMNIYDGVVIDKIWVGCSRFWQLPGCEDIPYVQTWLQVLKKTMSEKKISKCIKSYSKYYKFLVMTIVLIHTEEK